MKKLKMLEGKFSKTVRRETVAWAKTEYGEFSGWTKEIGVPYFTAWTWLKYGHIPNRDHEEAIRAKTPQCPLLKEIRKT